MALSKKQKEVVAGIERYKKKSLWYLWVTKWKDYTGPVIVIKERTVDKEGRKITIDRGYMYNGKLRSCNDVISYVLSSVKGDNGDSLNLQLLFDDKLEYRGEIPLDDVAGVKLALFFILQSTFNYDSKRIEVMGWRIVRFSFEEATYFLNKITLPIYGKKSMAWARMGLRIMLAGNAGDDDEVDNILSIIRK